MTPNVASAARHYRAFCKSLGIDLTKPDTKDTPERVASMFANELLIGQGKIDFKFTTFPVELATADQLVTVSGIEFHSLCAHHHQAIHGIAHVCYLPNVKLAGLSKLSRTVKWAARRPCMQEELTRLILDVLVAYLSPRFAAVRIVASHGCMRHRGVSDTQSLTTTQAFFENDAGTFVETRKEFEGSVREWYSAKGIA